MALALVSRGALLFASLPILGLLIIPVVALVMASSWSDLIAGVQHPLFASAFWLSLRTSIISLVLIVVFGTPLAWWLAITSTKRGRIIEVLVDLPIIIQIQHNKQQMHQNM